MRRGWSFGTAIVLMTALGAFSLRAQHVAVHGRATASTFSSSRSYARVFADGTVTAAIAVDGSLDVWGSNSNGQCLIPTLPAGMTYTDVAIMGVRVYALRSDGRVVASGLNEAAPTNLLPPPLPPGRSYVQIVAGSNHALALRDDGTVWGWGSNSLNQLNIPQLGPGQTHTLIAAGENISMGIRSNGQVDWWGSASTSFPSFGQFLPTTLPAGASAKKMVCSGSGGMILRTDGVLIRWGNASPQGSPTALATTAHVNDIASSAATMIALHSSTFVLALAYFGFPQFSVPPPPTGLKYVGVAIGTYHAAVLHHDGSIMCYGQNSELQRGVASQTSGTAYAKFYAHNGRHVAIATDGRALDATTNLEFVLNPTPPLPPFDSLALSDTLTALLGVDGSIYLRLNQNGFFFLIPGTGGPGNGVIQQVAAGADVVYGLRSDGQLLAWSPWPIALTIPPTIPAGLTCVGVSAAMGHGLARLSDGSVIAFGDNDQNQASVAPLPVGLSYVDIASGDYHQAALRSDGRILAWGRNAEGQCNVPALPIGVTYVSISAGSRHTVAKRSDGQVIAWGSDTYGQCSNLDLPCNMDATFVSATGDSTAVLLTNRIYTSNTIDVNAPSNATLGQAWIATISTLLPSTPYFADISLNSVGSGIPVQVGLSFPLNPPLLGIDLGGALFSYFPSIMQGFVGTTNALGHAAMIFNVPEIPELQGTRFWAAAGAFGSAPDGSISAVSNAKEVSLVAPRGVVSVTPAFGLTSGASPVLIRGYGFTPTAIVKFGGVAASGVNVIDAKTITCWAPPVGPIENVVDIHVIQGHVTDTLPQAFTYTTPLTFVSMTPSNPQPGASVTVHGMGFTSGTTLSIGGQAVPLFQVSIATAHFIMPSVPPCTQSFEFCKPLASCVVVPFNTTPALTGGTWLSGTHLGGTYFFVMGHSITVGSKLFIGGVQVPCMVSASTASAPLGTMTGFAPPSSTLGPVPISVASYLGCPATSVLNFVYN